MRRLLIPEQKSDPDYRQLWRIVDGAVTDAFNMHPDYAAFRRRRMHHIRTSIVKRIVGAVHGYQAEKGRSDSRSAAETEVALHYRGFWARLGKRTRKLAGLAPLASTYSRGRAA